MGTHGEPVPNGRSSPQGSRYTENPQAFAGYEMPPSPTGQVPFQVSVMWRCDVAFQVLQYAAACEVKAL